MSTITDDPRVAIGHEVEQMEAYLNGLREGFGPNKVGEIKQLPEVKELIEKAVLRINKEGRNLNKPELKAMVAKITHETELAIRKIASEKPEKKEKKEESSAVLPKKKETSPFDAENNIIDKGNNPENVNKGTNIAAVPEEKVKNNPILASSEPLPKKAEPNQLPGAQKGPVVARGGDADRKRETKPDRPLPIVPAPRKAPNVPIGNSPMPKKKTTNVFTASSTTPLKGAVPPPAKKLPPNGSPSKQKPKIPTIKIIIPAPPKHSESDIKAKTKAPKIGPLKPFPLLPPNYSDSTLVDGFDPKAFNDYPDPREDVLGNPNAEDYDPTPIPPMVPSRTTSDDADNDESPDDTSGGGSPSRRGAHRRRTKLRKPMNPFGGSNASMARHAIKGASVLMRMGPVGWGILAAIVVIFVVIALFFILGNEEETEQQQRSQDNASTETLTVRKEKVSPSTLEARMGDVVNFTITIQDQKPAREVIVIDHLPDNISYLDSNIISSWTNRTLDPIQRTITWRASQNVPTASLNPVNLTINVSYRIIGDRTHLITWTEVNAIPADTGASTSGGWVAPSTNTCNKYSSSMIKTPLQKNYGDPTCNFTKDQLYALLRQADPVNANKWFNQIVPCESGYNPNAYLGPQGGTPDAAGAWGLYQMGSSTPPGSPPPATGKNGPYDRGDLNWEMQTRNATTYGKKLSSLGQYWACARRTNMR